MDEKYVSIGKAAKLLGVSIAALRKWEDNGLIQPERTPTGHRRYRVVELQTLMHENDEKPVTRGCILYARVSTEKQEEAGSLDRQIGRLSTYATKQGWPISAVISDTASGLNERRHGLQKVLQLVARREASVVLVEYKDRFARFGFSYLESFVEAFGGQIVVMDHEEKDEQQELVEDLIAITTSFSARIYGKRGGKKLVEVVRSALRDPATGVGSE